MAKILITKGSMKIESSLNDLSDCKPTGDGIVFEFKNKMSIYVTDEYLSSQNKEFIKKSVFLSPKDGVTININFDKPNSIVSFTSVNE